MSMLSIQAVPALTDNYIWLIKSEDTDDVIIIDPGESAPVISVLNEQCQVFAKMHLFLM